jgi:hypothetical protein
MSGAFQVSNSKMDRTMMPESELCAPASSPWATAVFCRRSDDCLGTALASPSEPPCSRCVTGSSASAIACCPLAKGLRSVPEQFQRKCLTQGPSGETDVSVAPGAVNCAAEALRQGIISIESKH